MGVSSEKKSTTQEELDGLINNPKQLKQIIKYLLFSKELVLISNKFYLNEFIVELKNIVTEFLGKSPEGLKTSDFRDMIGLGRNVAIEILEYFDGQHFTRREGNFRFLRKRF